MKIDNAARLAIFMAEARGKGMGVGGPRQGDAGAEYCVCPECGYRVKHNRGTPCNKIKCIKCGAMMVGK